MLHLPLACLMCFYASIHGVVIFVCGRFSHHLGVLAKALARYLGILALDLCVLTRSPSLLTISSWVDTLPFGGE